MQTQEIKTMDDRCKRLELSLWSYFGSNPQEISRRAVETLRRRADSIRFRASCNTAIDEIIDCLVTRLFLNDDPIAAETLDRMACDITNLLETQQNKNTHGESVSVGLNLD